MKWKSVSNRAPRIREIIVERKRERREGKKMEGKERKEKRRKGKGREGKGKKERFRQYRYSYRYRHWYSWQPCYSCLLSLHADLPTTYEAVVGFCPVEISKFSILQYKPMHGKQISDIITKPVEKTLQWRYNGRDGVSNRLCLDCLLNRLFRRRSKKTSKLRVTGLCEGNSPVTGESPSQRASSAEKVSIWWRHHEISATGE